MGTILVAEDDDVTRTLVVRVLEGMGHQVVTATSGTEALEQAERHRPDLVITDVMMPRGHGYALCQQLRERPHLSAVKIVFLSSKSYEVDRKHAFDLGADEFLTKPFDVSQLKRTVTDLLARCAAKDHNGAG